MRCGRGGDYKYSQGPGMQLPPVPMMTWQSNEWAGRESLMTSRVVAVWRIKRVLDRAASANKQWRRIQRARAATGFRDRGRSGPNLEYAALPLSSLPVRFNVRVISVWSGP